MYSVNIANASLNAHADVSSGARGVKLGLGLHLRQYLLYASSEGSDETGYKRRSRVLVYE